jgi:hypothetical protein
MNGGGEQKILPPGDNFTPKDKIHRWGTNSSLGSNYYSRGEVNNM